MRLTLAGIALGAAAAAAHADAPAYTVQNITSYAGGPNSATPGYTFGWAFQASQPFRITALGAWDMNADGFIQTHDLYLWRADQTQLAHATIGPGASGTLASQSYRFITLATPIDVAAGDQLVIGGGWAGGDVTDFYPNPINAGQLTLDPRVTFTEGRISGSLNSFPYQPTVGPSMGAVNFLIQPVPAPATLAPFALGPLALRRRRSRGKGLA